nr:N-acetylated-alpha-linked acidic dipeptidase 2-like isoform X1 [Pocillopora verrucosa]
MSVQKKFVLGFFSFIFFIFIVGFITGYFSCPGAEYSNCCGAKNENDDTSRKLLEQEAFELISGRKIAYYLKYFANNAHLDGTNDSCAQALFIKNEWNSFGFDAVQLKRYDVLLLYPERPSVLSVNTQNGTEVYSSILKEDSTNKDNGPKHAIPFSTNSASGAVSGKLVYVNYGRESDFNYLDYTNISCKGKIVMLRYGRISEADKVTNAQKWSAAGVLLYVDPSDYSGNTTLLWYPSNEGPSMGLWVNRGDPVTPGYPATAGIYRETIDDIPFPKIPAQPIHQREAEILLRMLNHTTPPQDWQGGLNFDYRIQMKPNDTRTVTLNVSLSLVEKYVCDTVGTIKGKIEPDRYVLLGSHRPSSGTAILMEITRILLSVRKKGWFSRRSMKICSWGAGEYGNIGSIQWIEEYQKILDARAVAYINVDRAGEGEIVMTLSPLLEQRALQTAKKVTAPQNISKTLYSMWKEKDSQQAGNQSNLSLFDRAGRGCFAFEYRIGVPCVDIAAFQPDQTSGNYPAHIPRRHSSETIKYYLTFAQLWLQMGFDIAGSVFTPFNVVRQAEAICRLVNDLSVKYSSSLRTNNITLEFLINATQELQAVANEFQRNLKTQDNEDALQVRIINDRLQQLNRAFINNKGLSYRPFFRHVVFSPTYFKSEAYTKFPGIMDSFYIANEQGKKKDWQRVQKQISVVIQAIRSAITILRP